MVAANTQKLTAVFIYSRKDEYFKERFGDYLKLLQADDYLLGLSFQDIESLSPYRFREKVDNSDIFVFASSPHLFAHRNMKHPVFRRLASYHQTGRLWAAALICRPWKLEDTLLRSIARLPDNGQPMDAPSWKTEDEPYLLAYNILRRLCEERMEKNALLEQSWKLAQRSHDVEGYHTFLKSYPHSRYSEEARNLADNLSEAQLWAEAKEGKNLQHYFRYLLSPSQQKERLEEAALKIAEIEEDEERFWLDTKTQKGVEFFFRYKAMFPNGKHREEAEKQIRKFLKKPIPLAAGHVKASEHHYLMHLAYKRLPEEEYFSLSSYLLYYTRLRGYLEKIATEVSWRRYQYPLVLVPVFLAMALAFWQSTPIASFHFSVSGSLKTLFIILAFGVALFHIFRSLGHLYTDWQGVQEALRAIKQSGTFLKVGYLSNDPKAVWETLIRLRRLEEQLQAIEQKNFLDYLFHKRQARPEWVEREAAD